MSRGGQGTKCRRNIAENFNRLSTVHQRYRQTDNRQATDGRATAYSEREREFTFAKNPLKENSAESGSQRTIHALSMALHYLVIIINHHFVSG